MCLTSLTLPYRTSMGRASQQLLGRGGVEEKASIKFLKVLSTT